MLMNSIENTMIIVKTDALDMNLQSRIRSELTAENISVSELGLVEFDLSLVKEFYRWEEFEHPAAIEGYMCVRPVPAWIATGERAIERTLEIKRRLRKEFCVGRLKTLFHCSESAADLMGI